MAGSESADGVSRGCFYVIVVLAADTIVVASSRRCDGRANDAFLPLKKAQPGTLCISAIPPPARSPTPGLPFRSFSFTILKLGTFTYFEIQHIHMYIFIAGWRNSRRELVEV